MSATRGTRVPWRVRARRMRGRASASAVLGTVTRTISHPASTRRRIWATVASTSAVRGVVMDWTRIGLPPPTPTSPTLTSRVFLRRWKGGATDSLMARILAHRLDPGNRAAAGHLFTSVDILSPEGRPMREKARKLTDAEIQTAVKDLEGWRVENGKLH